MQLRYSWKFYLGIFLIVTSLIIGKVTLALFILHFNDVFFRWVMVVIYLLSWPQLILGIYWVGKEYAASVKKYVSYQFYHQSLKSGTQKIIHTTKAVGRHVTSKLRRKAPEKKEDL